MCVSVSGSALHPGATRRGGQEVLGTEPDGFRETMRSSAPTIICPVALRTPSGGAFALGGIGTKSGSLQALILFCCSLSECCKPVFGDENIISRRPRPGVRVDAGASARAFSLWAVCISASPWVCFGAEKWSMT